jgi:hypothetical protein
MSAAQVRFLTLDYEPCQPDQTPVRFSFLCPKRRQCEGLLLKGATDIPHDPEGKNGTPQWEWNGDRQKPTFTPSINCKNCWHGYIRGGRCVDTQGKDEPG